MRKGSNTFPSSESIYIFSLDLAQCAYKINNLKVIPFPSTCNLIIISTSKHPAKKFSYMVLVFQWNIINIQINLKNYYMHMQKNLIFFRGSGWLHKG